MMAERTNQSTVAGQDTQVKLSVIIACHNAADTIGEQLESLANQRWSGRWEIVVVDNRSTDASREVAERFRRHMNNLRIVDAFEKQGGAYALNVGICAARGEWLAICDADDVVADNWVAGMAAALMENELVSGPHETMRLNTSTLTKNRGNVQPAGIQHYTHPPYLPHAGAGNLGMRRRVFTQVGGFDESMVALFDTDFCWRAQLAGFRLSPVLDAVLHVRYRDSVASLYRQARLYGEWNVFIYKRYRAHGMPKINWMFGLLGWINLARRVGALFRSELRSEWVWGLGWVIGRVRGSLKYRVFAP